MSSGESGQSTGVAVEKSKSGQKRASWSGKWMFILAASASAVGLGNLWRFPYLAAKYGGGAFIFVYLLLVFTFGISMLLLETAFGRYTRKSAITAFNSFGKKYSIIGILASIVPFIITPYYCIIGGWVFKYFVSYITNPVESISDGGDFFVNFITSSDASFVFMALFMLLAIVIVFLGVDKGIEKANTIMMPLLLVFAVGIVIFTLTTPGAIEGVKYYLIPDFSKLSPNLFIGALGQMFYSLSLAMGIMITYGSYLKKEESLTSSVKWVGSCDLLVSVLAGLMIVPAAFAFMGSADAVAAKAGPSLMFITLPGVFSSMGSVARIIGTIFFLLVLFAALTSAISLIETCVSIIADKFGMIRKRAIVVSSVIIVVCGVFINSGYNILSFIEPLGPGTTLLDFFDFISNSVLMPIVALMTCIFIGWIIKPKFIIDEVKLSSPFTFEKAWTVMIKYIAPVLLVVILAAYVAAQFGLFSM